MNDFETFSKMVDQNYDIDARISGKDMASEGITAELTVSSKE